MTEGCNKKADFRYTWPGKNESYICHGHAGSVEAIANAIGMSLQLIPIPKSDHPLHPDCAQMVVKQLPDSKGGQS